MSGLFLLDRSLHICKTAFLLTLIAYFITIFTIELLPSGSHCSHLVQSPVCVNLGYFHFISKSCISALSFWKSQRAVWEEPEGLLVLLLPPVCVSSPQLLHTQALLSLIPLASTCSLQRFTLSQWLFKWGFVWARSLFLGARLLSSGQTWKLPWILIWMGFVGLNCLNVL